MDWLKANVFTIVTALIALYGAVSAREVASGLAEQGMLGTVKIRAVASDGTGVSFTSKAVEFDISGLMRA